MSKFSNMMKLILILKSSGRVSSKVLAEKLDTSDRMVRKYIKDLTDAGVCIDSLTGPTGGYELIGHDFLVNTKITAKEYAAFVLLKEKCNNLSEEEKENINSLQEKLLYTKNLTASLKDASNNIYINSRVSNLYLQNNIEDKLFMGILDNRKIKISYTSNSSGYSERVLHPYEIISRDGFKYLIAFCELRKEFRLFKLVRIKSIEVTEKEFERGSEEGYDEYLRDNKPGVFSGNDIFVKLLIKKPFSYTVKERIYCSDQVITEIEDEGIIFQGTLNGKEDVIRWILGMKSAVKVLQPIELGEEIRDELNKMLDNI